MRTAGRNVHPVLGGAPGCVCRVRSILSSADEREREVKDSQGCYLWLVVVICSTGYIVREWCDIRTIRSFELLHPSQES